MHISCMKKVSVFYLRTTPYINNVSSFWATTRSFFYIQFYFLKGSLMKPSNATHPI